MGVIHQHHQHHHRHPIISSLPQSPPSNLNPNAPIFLPMKSYLTVQDFSDEWWDLVHSSPFFRDYWLQDSFTDDYSPQNAPSPDEPLNLPDFDAFFDLYLQYQPPQDEKEEGEKRDKEMITLGSLKYSKSRKVVEPPRGFDKVPKIVKNVRANPRTIHQPR